MAGDLLVHPTSTVDRPPKLLEVTELTEDEESCTSQAARVLPGNPLDLPSALQTAGLAEPRKAPNCLGPGS